MCECLLTSNIKLQLSLKLFSFCLCIFFLGALPCSAQKITMPSSDNTKAVKFYRQAGAYYDQRRNQEALDELKKAIEKDKNFVEAYMLMGDIYSDMGDKEKSSAAYEEALRINPSFFPNTFMNLAKEEMKAGKYKEALDHLEKFLQQKDISKENKQKAMRDTASCRFATYAMEHPVPFNPQNLGENINSEFYEYHPQLTADEKTLIFTRRSNLVGGEISQNEMREDFYISTNNAGVWDKAIGLGKPINTVGDEGAHCISPDGHYMYFTACGRSDGYGRCDIYFSERNGDAWSEPVNLGATVNSRLWDAQPTISSDGNTLYFVSTRDGGFGGSDIWKTTKDKDGNWTAPLNLGATVNSSEDEQSPYIHPDNKTLYFSSKGHRGMGGFDIFMTKKVSKTSWSEPVNLGYPLNTGADDYSFFVTADGAHAYFASDRPEGKGKQDIYRIDLYAAARPTPVTYVKGVVHDNETMKKLRASIELYDLSTAELVTSSVSDKITGEYLVCLPSGRNFALNVSREGYLFYSENFSLADADTAKVPEPFRLDVGLEPIKVGQSTVLKNIFFETAKAELKSDSRAELERIAIFLNANPDVKIEITGHTDNVGEKKYNLGLSDRRAQSVYNYLIANGISASRLSYKGYGDTKPVATNDTEGGRQLNRRTEMVISATK
jgi:outer membrane protein OmpA-like peptidoglycan-associated protein/tetratricopeptide (TPR) repeat protein